MPVFHHMLPFKGLPDADDKQAKEFLRGTTCVVCMSGSSGVHFSAPASLLSRLSAPIEALVNSVVEGTDASASLDVADEGLFYRLCQFVFTGTYDGFTKLENEGRRDCIEGTAPSIAETCMNESADTELTNAEFPPGSFGASIAPFRVSSTQSSGGSLFGNQNQPTTNCFFGSSETTGGGGLFGGKRQAFTSTSCFRTSETTGGGGLFGGKSQALNSTKCFGISETTGGGGLFGGKSQAPASTGLFETSGTPGGGGSLNVSSLFGGSCVPNGLQLPYSLLSSKETLDEATTCKTRPKKRKREELNDSEDCLHLSFKSRAISAFLQNDDQMYPSPPYLDNRSRSLENVLGHAKMWYIAEKYAIKSLMDVASSSFTSELARWVINDSEFITDFGRVLSYLYRSRAGDNALQLLIAQFAACIVDDVRNLDSWAELMKDVPAFHYDLVHALVKVYCP